MNVHTICLKALAALLALLPGGMLIAAEESPPPFQWSAQDVGGKQVNVPGDRPTVLLFVRADQPQSQQALKEAKSSIPSDGSAQAIVIVSGVQSAEQAKLLSGGPANGWPIVADPDYAASGKSGVHVWPTTIIVDSKGQQVAHLAGLSKQYSVSLDAYIAFASGKIDKDALKKRLETPEMVMDTPTQQAARHLQVAQLLLEKGRAEQAKSELEAGLKLNPDSPVLQLGLVKAMLMLNQPAEAAAILARIPAGAAPQWHVSILKARALIGQQKWDEAKAVLPDALKLNPNLSEARYLMGLVYEHEKDFPKAAAEFRAAFEASQPNQKLATP